MSRSFVVAFLKKTKKEATMRLILAHTSALTADERLGQDKVQACQPERIIEACKTLSKWNQIILVSRDVYCLPQYMPKFRTLDDTWMI